MKTEVDFYNKLYVFRTARPSLRWGQAAFVMVHEMYPEIANKLSGTECDSFYDDNRIHLFIKACLQEISK